MKKGWLKKNKLAVVSNGEHYSHMVYLALVSIEGHGLYAKAAVVAFIFVVAHFVVSKNKH